MRKNFSIPVMLTLILFSRFYSQMVYEDVKRLSDIPVNNNIKDREFFLFLFASGEKYRIYPQSVQVHPLAKLEGLYKENYDGMAVTLGVNISPLSVNGNIDLTFKTFGEILELPFGIIVGTGWYCTNFGSGIGIYSNFYDGSVRENLYSAENFSKIYLKYYTGLCLKYDFYNLLPAIGHFQLGAGAHIYYRYFLGTTKDTDIWWYENHGDNLKYFRANFMVYAGYKFPILLSKAGVFYLSDYDIQHYSDSPSSKGGWGSDIPFRRFGVILGVGRESDVVSGALKLTWGNEIAYEEGYGYNVILYDRRVKLPEKEYYFLKEVSLFINVRVF